MKDELLISGYVRSNSQSFVPFAIIQICMVYFICIEEWDIKNKGKHMEISGESNEKCEITHAVKGSRYQSVLGITKVDKGKHHWKFKIMKFASNMGSWRIVIGITKIDKLDDEKLKKLFDSYISCNHASYGLVVNCGNTRSFLVSKTSAGYPGKDYGKVCNKDGDVIDMYLDLDNMILRFGINGLVYGNAYDKIEKTAYKMVMTLNQAGTVIELISYQEIDNMPQVNYK